jgi:hypothetical protein
MPPAVPKGILPSARRATFLIPAEFGIQHFSANWDMVNE